MNYIKLLTGSVYLADNTGTVYTGTTQFLNTVMSGMATADAARFGISTVDPVAPYSKQVYTLPDGMGTALATATPTGGMGQLLYVPGIAALTSTPLAANTSWNTGWIPYGQYQSATTIIFSDVASATGGLKYEYSADGGTTILESPSTTFTNLNEFRVASFPVGKGTHVRVTFTNGAVQQNKFYFGLYMHTDIIESMNSTWTLINSSNIAAISKTFLQAPDTNVSGTAVWDMVTRTGNSLNVNVTNPAMPITQDYRDYIWMQTVAGNSFVWSTGLIGGLALATNLRAYINNPAGSGKTLYVYSMAIDNGAGSAIFATLLAAPTTNLPATSRGTGNNLNMGNATASPITLYADTGSAMTGGVTLPAPFIAGSTRTEFLGDSQVYIVPAGSKVGINIPIGIGLSTNYQIVVYGIVL